MFSSCDCSNQQQLFNVERAVWVNETLGLNFITFFEPPRQRIDRTTLCE